MKAKFILLLLISFLIPSFVKSVDPLVSLPPKPPSFEVYTESEDLYFYKCLELYQIGLILRTQIQIYGNAPSVNLPSLDRGVVDNMDAKFLQKLYNSVEKLYQQVKSIQGGIFCRDLEKQLIDARKTIDSLIQDNTTKNLQLLDCKSLQTKVNILQDFCNKLFKIRDSLELVIFENKKQKIYKGRNIPNIGGNFEVSGKYFFFGDNRVKTLISPSFGLSLNLLRIGEDYAYIRFWGDYDFYKSRVEVPLQGIEVFYENFYDDQWSMGLDFEFNLSKLFNLNKPYWGLGMNLGYLKGFSKHSNEVLAGENYSGIVLSAKTRFSKFSTYLPFGVFGGVNFHYLIDPKKYNVYPFPIEVQSRWIPSIYLGLEFELFSII